MEEMIQAFIQVLKKENEILDKLLTFAEEKKGIIVLGKVQELDKLLQRENLVIINLEKTEKNRLELHEKLARQWGTSAAELPAREILKKCQESTPVFSDQLKQEINYMETAIHRLRDLNHENNELIGASLEYIDNMQAILMGDMAGVYSHNGTPTSDNNARPARHIFDKKA